VNFGINTRKSSSYISKRASIFWVSGVRAVDVVKKHNLTISFFDCDGEKMKHITEAEKALVRAGVHFDTGYDFQEKKRDWFFDWSLKGAIVKLKDNLEEENGKGQKHSNCNERIDSSALVTTLWSQFYTCPRCGELVKQNELHYCISKPPMTSILGTTNYYPCPGCGQMIKEGEIHHCPTQKN